MPNLAPQDLDVSRLLFDLKLCAEVVNEFTGCLLPSAIATSVTNSLIEKFDCVFARIWLVDSERDSLKLVASSGLYSRLDGSFASVPMGSFKVGKIAQHCIPFLSNCLPEESWVKDRDWAIVNNIQGFAGLPLMAEGQAIGVLAVFSVTPMEPEFLEVLQILSLSVTGALASALNHQALAQSVLAQSDVGKAVSEQSMALSEQLAAMLGHQKLSLLGTEQPLEGSIHQLLIDLATCLLKLPCHYCRLVYEADAVVLEAMLAAAQASDELSVQSTGAVTSHKTIQEISKSAQQLGGSLTVQSDNHETVVAIRLQLPRISANAHSSRLNQQTQEPSSEGSPLSEREQEVMQLLVQGLRDRDIAEKLFISERTVKFHAKNMVTKLGVKTRIQAAFKATKAGWVS
ncbi:MAG: LuxR C-terminal-related transcriptional regulator [Cyanobacteria bacterium P01_F01_bin.53]